MFTRSTLQRISKAVRASETESSTGLGTKKRRIIRHSSGGLNVDYVLDLPPIPTKRKGTELIFWCNEETGMELFEEPGTGDDQIWKWSWPQTRWYPMQKCTHLSGISGGTPE